MKIKISKSQWEEMGKKAGWDRETKNQILNETDDFLDKARKNLMVVSEVDLALELQKFQMKVLDRRVK